MKNQNVEEGLEKSKRLVLNLTVDNLRNAKIMNKLVDLKIAIDEMFNLIKPAQRPLFLRKMSGERTA